MGRRTATRPKATARPKTKVRAAKPKPSSPPRPSFEEAFLAYAPQVRRVILLVLLVGAPLLVIGSLNDPINVPKLALLIAGVPLVAAIRGIELLLGASAQGLKRLLVPALAFAVPIGLSWLFSAYRGWALFGEYKRFQGVIPYLLLIAFGILLADAFGARLRTLAWGTAAVGSAMALFALLQWTQLFAFASIYARAPRLGVAVGTLGNPNFAGGFLAIALPVALTLALTEETRRKLLLAMTALIAIGVVVSFSQGPWAAALASVLVVAGFHFRDRSPWLPRLGLAAAALIAVIVIATAFAVFIAPDRSAALPLSIRLRGYWWQSAVAMALDAPLFGHGPNTFGFLGVQYRPFEEAVLSAFEFPDDPHSVFFSMLANAGIVGALGYLVALGWVVKRALGVNRWQPLSVAFLAALVAYFIQSLASIDELALRLLFWTSLAGFAIATSFDEGAVPGQEGRRR